MNDNTQKQHVWESRLDARYDIVVDRVPETTHQGVLRVFDSEEGNKEIFTENVGLSYGAMFGPDVADVAEWQDIVVHFIDNEYDPLPPPVDIRQ